jgi:CDP-paratose 2-epimerase
MFGLRAIVNRCGVVSGPWQMGHAEQGVFAHWMMAHAFARPLAYIGFGGQGHQVRDVLHVEDLGDLIDLQLAQRASLDGDVVNAGGGLANSVSLREFTRHCEALTGTALEIACRPETRPGDVPVYITDNAKVRARFGWEPRRSVDDLARDLHRWIREQEPALREALGLS